MKILILFAHPAYQKSRINRPLMDAVRDLQDVSVHDLYERYPDFHIDVPHEQALLRAHDLIVLHHPFYWYSVPALLKEWLDLVLEYGFAYGSGGTALRGKWLLSAITTGGSAATYTPEGLNRYPMHTLLAPFVQTARLCEMAYLPPFVVHGTHRLTDHAHIEPHAHAYRDLLTALRDGRLTLAQMEGSAYLNDCLPLI